MRGFRYLALIVASLLASALALAGCGRDTSALGQIQPGDTVYADLWNEDADEGDQAGGTETFGSLGYRHLRSLPRKAFGRLRRRDHARPGARHIRDR